jgi:hypothetical protein
MSTTPKPIFDMSKAKPIFDMSKAKPIKGTPVPSSPERRFSITPSLNVSEPTMRRITGSLPALGATAGAALGAPGIVTGGIGAALGGAAGESLHQILNRALGLPSPATSLEAEQSIERTGATMGALEAGGGLAVKGAGMAAKALAESKAGTAAARLIERLPGTVEGEPVADVVGRVFKRIGVEKDEPLRSVQAKVTNASKAIADTEQQLLASQKYVGQNLVSIGDLPADTQPIAQSLRNSVSHYTRTLEPKTAREVANRANAWASNRFTIQDLKDALNDLNKQTQALASKPGFQQSVARGDPGIKSLQDETKAVRDAYYDQLSRATGRDLRQLKRTQSDLIEMQKALGGSVGREAKEQASARAHRIIGGKGSTRRRLLRRAALAAGAGAGAGAGYELVRHLTGE